MKFNLFLALTLFLVHCSVFQTKEQIVTPPPYVPVPARVIAKSSLLLRENPGKESKVLESLPGGFIITTLDKIESADDKNKITQWYKTIFRKKTGWVSGTYLSFDEKAIDQFWDIKNSRMEKQKQELENFLNENYDPFREFTYQKLQRKLGKPIKYTKVKVKNIHDPDAVDYMITAEFKEATFQIYEGKYLNAVLGIEFHMPDLMKKGYQKFFQYTEDDLINEFNFPDKMNLTHMIYYTLVDYSDTLTFQLENGKVKTIKIYIYID